ncbi:MAG: hypothetical protein WAT77_07955 [Paracoccaceae bacterium]
MRMGIWAALAVMAGANGAHAGEAIEAACLRTGGSALSELCSCIQDAADLTLGQGEQRRAATFFRNPDRAQVYQTSTKQADQEFWSRYLTFTQQAQTFCSAG